MLNSTAATAGGANPKTISAYEPESNYVVIYKVPNGRKFSGHLLAGSTSAVSWFEVNRKTIKLGVGATVPVSLFPGDTISAANSGGLVGVETDA